MDLFIEIYNIQFHELRSNLKLIITKYSELYLRYLKEKISMVFSTAAAWYMGHATGCWRLSGE